MAPAEEPITRTVVADFRLPVAKPTDRVQVREIKIAPSQPAGLHVHNGPVFGSIVAGSVIYQIDGQAASMLRPGDVFYEPKASASPGLTPRRMASRSWPTSCSPPVRILS